MGWRSRLTDMHNQNDIERFLWTEAVAKRCTVKKVFLEISQSSQKKHLYQSLFFNKVAGLKLY